MESIFIKEEEVLKKAISTSEIIIETVKDKEIYMALVEEYKELLEQMKRMVRMSDMMENKLNYVRRSIDEISKLDFLTNIFNRRYFNQVITEQWGKCKQDKESLGIIMIDVDEFKAYNDIYGHLNGDECLKKVSKVIKNFMKESNNIVSRYGGEEFIVLIPNSDLKNVQDIGENIRKDVEKLSILHEGSEKYGVVTISIGISTCIPDKKSSPEKLINAADEALYRAKSFGRNKVAI
jgi:diguanylate cyclase (GGDEF)-like protein